jgi:hypothetical protein
VQPVFRAGTSRVRVQIARAGVRALRGGRRTDVRVSARLRDVAARSASARPAAGALR